MLRTLRNWAIVTLVAVAAIFGATSSDPLTPEMVAAGRLEYSKLPGPLPPNWWIEGDWTEEVRDSVGPPESCITDWFTTLCNVIAVSRPERLLEGREE